ARAEPDRRRAGGGDRVPERGGVAPAAIDLEAVLAGVAGAGDEAVEPRDAPGGAPVVADGRQLEAREWLEHRLGLRPLHREEPGGVGDVAEPHVDGPRLLLVDDVLPGPRAVRRVAYQHVPVV